MKIAVTSADGDTEIITLYAPVRVFGENRHQNLIQSADGYDHYFTLDGFYDGWGRSLPEWTNAQAYSAIKETESQRQIIRLTLSRFIVLKLRSLYRRLRWYQGYLLQRPGYPPLPWKRRPTGGDR